MADSLRQAGARPVSLFSAPKDALLADLDKALASAARAFAVPASRRSDLTSAVRDLSRLLTEERGDLAQSYWAAPRFVGAYLRYFLPWNLLRMAWLLPGLDMPLRAGDRVLDLGSGPLTLPLALWIARPDLRGVPLDVVCSDVSPKILERGRDIFQALAGDASPWRISLLRSPADAALRSHAGKGVSLVMAGNMLNERMRRRDGRGETTRPMDSLMAGVAACLAPGGRVLLLEPGTRLGGGLVSQCREAAIEQGFGMLAPCTHSLDCPLASLPMTRGGADRGGLHEAPFGSRQGQARRSWCHFIVPATGAPPALAALSAEAGLEKERMALSFLFLEAPDEGGGKGPASSVSLADELDELEALYREIAGEDEEGALYEGGHDYAPVRSPAEGEAALVRVVSGPIALPGQESARYVCGPLGLGLLLDAARLHSGTGLLARPLGRGERDAKSGALLMRREAADEPRQVKRPAPEGPARRSAENAQGRQARKPLPSGASGRRPDPRGGKRHGHTDRPEPGKRPSPKGRAKKSTGGRKP